MGGAPVPRIFLHMMNNQPQPEKQDQREQDQETDSSLIPTVSPIRSRTTNKTNIKSSIKDSSSPVAFARSLEQELAANMSMRDSVRDVPQTSSVKTSTTPLDVVMHCREIGLKIAENMSNNNNSIHHGGGGLKGNASHLLKQIIEILISYGQEQQHQNDEHRATITHLQNQLHEFTEARAEIEEKKRSDEVRRGEKRKTASLEGLQEKYNKMFPPSATTEKNAENAVVDDDDDTEAAAIEAEEERTLSDDAKSRKTMIKQIVQIQGQLLAEKETILQLEKAKEDLKKRLDDQIDQQSRRDEDQRSLMMKSTENHDDLQQRYRDRVSEISALKSEVKELQNELDDKIWLGTIEVESTNVATAMLRKHCKDTETRTALTTMRLRQEQELVTKLKRKLNEMSAVFNACLHDVTKMKEEWQQNQQMLTPTNSVLLSGQTSPTQHINSPTKSAATIGTENNNNNNNNSIASPTSSSSQSPSMSVPPEQQQHQHHQQEDDDGSASSSPHHHHRHKQSLHIVDSVILSLQLASKQMDEVINSTTNPTGELAGGGIAIASVTTPRPDKDQIARSVPSLGKAQAEASTTAMVDALVQIIRSQDERLKAESRSWNEAQNQADIMLQKRKNKQFENAETQT